MGGVKNYVPDYIGFSGIRTVQNIRDVRNIYALFSVLFSDRAFLMLAYYLLGLANMVPVPLLSLWYAPPMGASLRPVPYNLNYSGG